MGAEKATKMTDGDVYRLVFGGVPVADELPELIADAILTLREAELPSLARAVWMVAMRAGIVIDDVEPPLIGHPHRERMKRLLELRSAELLEARVAVSMGDIARARMCQQAASDITERILLERAQMRARKGR